MERLWVAILALCAASIVHSQDPSTAHGISLSLSPASGKTRPGTDATLTCDLDTALTGVTGGSLMWSRRTGNLTYVIARSTLKVEDFVGQKRYRTSLQVDPQQRKATYHLTLTDLRLEDSGTFYCTVTGSTRGDSKVLAVCAEPTSKTCDCVLQKGWATPDCYGDSKSNYELQKSFDTTITGIGVCFAIAVIYGVIITVLFAKDVIRILRQKRKRAAMRAAMQARQSATKRDPYADSEQLTLDPNEETASVPDSGVFETNTSGRRRPAPPRAVYQDNMARSRPAAVKTQAHVNAAYDANDADDDVPASSPYVEKRPAPARPPPPGQNNTPARPPGQMHSAGGLSRSREHLAEAPPTIEHTPIRENTPREHLTPRDHHTPQDYPPEGTPSVRPRTTPSQSERPYTDPRYSDTRGQDYPPQDGRYDDNPQNGRYDNTPQSGRYDNMPQSGRYENPPQGGRYDNNRYHDGQTQGPYIDDHDTEI